DLDHREFSSVRVMRELARRSGGASAVMPVVFSTLVGAGLPEDFDPEWLEGLDYTLARAPQLALECLVYEYRGGLALTWDTVDEARSERRPDPAVITAERVLTYAELDRLACRIGRRLRQSGAQPNRLVAVVMDKGWEQVAAVLGVLYSGAAYLPIDASLPPER